MAVDEVQKINMITERNRVTEIFLDNCIMLHFYRVKSFSAKGFKMPVYLNLNQDNCAVVIDNSINDVLK